MVRSPFVRCCRALPGRKTIASSNIIHHPKNVADFGYIYVVLQKETYNNNSDVLADD